MSGDAGPPDQEIQVSPSPPPPAPGSPRSAATLCLVTICLSLTTARRGFGFVTFMDQAGVDKVLAQSRHELDSKTVSGPRGFGGLLGEGGRWRRGAGLCPGLWAGGRGGVGAVGWDPGRKEGVCRVEGLPRSETLSVELRGYGAAKSQAC